jgi:outer membrane protein assembly factor BamB
MKSLRHPIHSILIIVIASLLSACVGTVLPSGFPGLSSDQNTAYLAFNQYIYAVDLSNGTQKWRYPDKGSSNETFFATPALTPDGQLIVGSYNNTLYSVDTSSKAEKWQFTAKDRFVAGPLVTPQGIFAPSTDNMLYALNYAGKLLWSFAAQGPNWATPATNDQCDCIYLPSMDHYLYTLNAKTGALLWKVDLGSAMVGTPSWGPDNTLYLGNFGNQMVAINGQNGEIRWKTALQGWVWGGPILDGNNLYFGDLNGNFYSLQASDGKILWKIVSDGPITGSPLVTPDAIYFTTDVGSLYAINRDSKIKWTQAVGGKIYSPPVLAGNIILVTPEGIDSVLAAYNSNGGQVWPQFIPPK